MGVSKQANIVHLIDFGLSKKYRNPKTHAHIAHKDSLGLTGTAIFASINSHLGLELGRHNDLKSLAYILFYLLWGSLLWQGLENKNMLESKRARSAYSLFHKLPMEFRTFLEHCHSLSFDDKPNYGHFLTLFDNLSSRKVLSSDTAFNWDVAEEKIVRWGRRESVKKNDILKHEGNHPVKHHTE